MSTHAKSRYVRPPLSIWLGTMLAAVLLQPFTPETAHPSYTASDELTLERWRIHDFPTELASSVETRVTTLIVLGYDLETQEEVPDAEVLDRVRGILKAEFPIDASLDLRAGATGLERLDFEKAFSATTSPREEQAVMRGDFFFGPNDKGWNERPA